ncbi:MAG: UDP-2,3-diacylglucosamine hydrolase, partial [Candidatus Thiodiazotropha sp.]
AVAGVKPQRWVLTAAGRTCREAFVLPGAMSEAVAAYSEYLKVLARQQAVGQAAIPAEYQDACDSAIHVYAPTSLLDKGLILNAWDDQSYREELLDFRRDFKVSESDFVLPQGYQRVPMMSGF